MEAKTSAFLFCNIKSTATASAEPSEGSVPVPTSSSKTSESESADKSIFLMLDKWELNVERSSSIDCSSPISTKILLNL